MLSLPSGTKVYLASKPVDMRKGFAGLSVLASEVFRLDPYSGHVFLFRSKRGNYLKALVWDGTGLCLFAKRLEHGKFVWPQVTHGTVALTPAQLSMLLEGIDWRRPARTAPNRAA